MKIALFLAAQLTFAASLPTVAPVLFGHSNLPVRQAHCPALH